MTVTLNWTWITIQWVYPKQFFSLQLITMPRLETSWKLGTWFFGGGVPDFKHHVNYVFTSLLMTALCGKDIKPSWHQDRWYLLGLALGYWRRLIWEDLFPKEPFHSLPWFFSRVCNWLCPQTISLLVTDIIRISNSVLSIWMRWLLVQLRVNLAYSYMVSLMYFISSGVLESAHTSSHELIENSSSQLHFQWHHLGSLKSTMLVVLIPGKLAHAINPAFHPTENQLLKHLLTYYCFKTKR